MKVLRVDLNELGQGDRVLVETLNSKYLLEVLKPETRMVSMKSSNQEAPEGKMTLMGCALGAGSSLAPDRLFCGGHLELNFKNEFSEVMTHTTSSIQAVYMRQG